MANEKGQVETQPVKEVDFSDGFDKKWDEMMSGSFEAAPEQKKTEEVKKEEECPECEKEKQAKAAAEAAKAKAPTEPEKKPYKVLKVQGKEVPVYSEDELVNLAQMGVDYTKKTQGLSEERKAAEAEITKKHDELETLADKFNKMFDKMTPGQVAASATPGGATTEAPVTMDAMYKEYGIEPEYAEPYQKKMIQDAFQTRKETESLKKELESIKGVANLLLIKETTMKLGEIIKDERSKFPIDEIMSEDGTQNLTQKQFIAAMMAKEKEIKATGKEPNLDALARETVREVHEMQKRAKANASPSISNDMKPEEIERLYPDLYAKLQASIKDKAVAEYETDKAKVPPTLTSKKQGVDLSKIDHKKPEDKDDWIDEGFKDPEIQAALRGER